MTQVDQTDALNRANNTGFYGRSAARLTNRVQALEAALRKARNHIADIDSASYADDDAVIDLIDAALAKADL